MVLRRGNGSLKRKKSGDAEPQMDQTKKKKLAFLKKMLVESDSDSDSSNSSDQTYSSSEDEKKMKAKKTKQRPLLKAAVPRSKRHLNTNNKSDNALKASVKSEKNDKPKQRMSKKNQNGIEENKQKAKPKNVIDSAFSVEIVPIPPKPKKEAVASNGTDEKSHAIPSKSPEASSTSTKRKRLAVSDEDEENSEEEGEIGEIGEVKEEIVAPPKPLPVVVEAEKEEQEESSPKQMRSPLTTKKKPAIPEDPSAPRPAPGLLIPAFTIPKKKFKRGGDSNTSTPIVTTKRPSILPGTSGSTNPTKATILSPSPTRTSSPNQKQKQNQTIPFQHQVLPKRTKKPVPASNIELTRGDKEFLAFATRNNSLLAALEHMGPVPLTDRLTGRGDQDGLENIAKTAAEAYGVVDSSGHLWKESYRMECPHKKKIEATEGPEFFGIGLTKCIGKQHQEDDASTSISLPSYERLEFQNRKERDWYQNRFYGKTFLPLYLRSRVTFCVKTIRYERKSSGFMFNSKRDKEELGLVLSERYKMNKTIPRCDIPLRSWTNMMKKEQGQVFLHYNNVEDAMEAYEKFRDDQGNPFEFKGALGYQMKQQTSGGSVSPLKNSQEQNSSPTHHHEQEGDKAYDCSRSRSRDHRDHSSRRGSFGHSAHGGSGSSNNGRRSRSRERPPYDNKYHPHHHQQQPYPPPPSSSSRQNRSRSRGRDQYHDDHHSHHPHYNTDRRSSYDSRDRGGGDYEREERDRRDYDYDDHRRSYHHHHHHRRDY